MEKNYKNDISFDAIKNHLESTLLNLSNKFSDRKKEYYKNFDAAFVYDTNIIDENFEKLNFKIEAILNETNEYGLIELSSIEENELNDFVNAVENIKNNWSSAINQSDKLLQFNYLTKLNEKLKSYEIDALNIKKKLKKAKNNLAKIARKKQKILKNLIIFGKFIEVIEDNLNNTLNDSNLNELEKQNELIKIQENCQKFSEFVAKLETITFGNDSQKKLADEYCKRFATLINRFDNLNLLQIKLLSVNVEVEKRLFNSASTSVALSPSNKPYRSSSCSFSLASSSTFSENTTDTEDLDEDLFLIQNKFTQNVNDWKAVSCPVSSNVITKNEENFDKLYLEIVSCLSNNTNISLESFETTINNIINGFENFYKIYHPCVPLKTLNFACKDLHWLKAKIKEISRCKLNIKNLLKLKSNKEMQTLIYKFLTKLKHSKHVAKLFYKDLLNEIDEETSLRINYNQIINNLNYLEAEIREASEGGKLAKTSKCLNKIEIGIDLLNKQCCFPRKYVETSIDGSRNISPIRRNKIILQITKSVITIIEVIEKELQKQNNSTLYSNNNLNYESENEIVQLHQKLLDLRKKMDLENKNISETLKLIDNKLTEQSSLTPFQSLNLKKINNQINKSYEYIISTKLIMSSVEDIEFILEKINVSLNKGQKK